MLHAGGNDGFGNIAVAAEEDPALLVCQELHFGNAIDGQQFFFRWRILHDGQYRGRLQIVIERIHGIGKNDTAIFDHDDITAKQVDLG